LRTKAGKVSANQRSRNLKKNGGVLGRRISLGEKKEKGGKKEEKTAPRFKKVYLCKNVAEEEKKFFLPLARKSKECWVTNLRC